MLYIPQLGDALETQAGSLLVLRCYVWQTVGIKTVESTKSLLTQIPGRLLVYMK